MNPLNRMNPGATCPDPRCAKCQHASRSYTGAPVIDRVIDGENEYPALAAKLAEPNTDKDSSHD